MEPDKNTGVYRGLVAQVNRIHRHTRQGSYETKKRYKESELRFCAFEAVEFHVQKLENIRPEHIVAYVEFMIAAGKAPATIKNELSGIRFYHDQLSSPRYRLPSNAELGVMIEKRRYAEKDRTWSDAEFHRALAIAQAEGHDDYITAFYLARFAGLRIHECFRIDTAIAEDALRERAIMIKGKGGKVRTVPIEDERITMMLKKMLAKTVRGHKLLVPDGVPKDKEIHALQLFLLKHRDEIQDPDDTRPLTFHGLRHNYGSSKYRELTDRGMSSLDASFTVSHLLGHNRRDVTNIYTVSVRKKGDADGK